MDIHHFTHAHKTSRSIDKMMTTLEQDDLNELESDILYHNMRAVRQF